MVLKLFKRIVHENVLIEDCHQERSQWLGYDWNVSQVMTGDVNATLVIGIPTKLLLKIATKMLEEPFEDATELVQDASKEFLNVMCGNICAKLSQRDLVVNLEPPAIVQRTYNTELPAGYAVITSLIAVESRFNLAIIQHEK
ncbi:MAG: chemotaxis protein CheX, partial [Candidatus Sericytochromatia bacterium]|nr:chemotaxis protein CheX [Candidatus Tanganyikabacteria bacterium]